jgi:hypothetical protein
VGFVKVYRDGLSLEVEGPPRVVQRNGHTCEVFKTEDGEMWFVTLEGTHFCAHGDSFHDAVIAAKEKQSPGAGKADAIERIQKSGLVNLTDFCLVTGACRAGATAWAKGEGISVRAELKVADVLARLEKSSSQSWGEQLREELKNEWNN